MFKRFSKTNSHIKYNLLRFDSKPRKPVQSFAKKIIHLGSDVAIHRILLHGRRRALHVHGNVTNTGFCHEFSHFLISTIGRHVIDDAGTCFNGSPGHDRFHRINGNRNGNFRHQLLEHRQHTALFLFFGHGNRPRPRRFTTNVKNVRALFYELQRVKNSSFRACETSPVRKRIRRDVHDTHHHCGSRENEFKFSSTEKHQRRESSIWQQGVVNRPRPHSLFRVAYENENDEDEPSLNPCSPATTFRPA